MLNQYCRKIIFFGVEQLIGQQLPETMMTIIIIKNHPYSMVMLSSKAGTSFDNSFT